MINVFVTHFVDEPRWDVNAILLEQLNYMRAVGARVEHRVDVLYWCPQELDDRFIREVTSQAPWVCFYRNTRAGRPDIQPSLRNFADELATDVYVLLHNDVRVSVGWLDRLAEDLQVAEARFGRRHCLVHPRYVPYYYLPGFALPTGMPTWLLERAKTVEEMRAWCETYGFFVDDQGRLWSTRCPTTDDGHQLMMYITRKGYFDPVGPCDERFTGYNYDDVDWGLRALKAGRKNLTSQSCLIAHFEGVSFFHPNAQRLPENKQLFREKWGEAAFARLQSGALWRDIRNRSRK